MERGPEAERLFPYSLRTGQKDLLEAMELAQAKRVPFVFEGPTGVGKTVCALSSAIALAKKHDKRVLYLTRTNSQQAQVMREARAISAIESVSACGVQGRRRSCPIVSEEKDLQEGSPEELSKVCGRRKRMVLEGRDGGCRYYEGFRKIPRSDILDIMRSIRSPEELAETLVAEGVCPHEATKEFMSESLVVSAPYVYFFNPVVRRSLLESMRVGMEELIVVVDEAHNLPDYARELMSISLGAYTIERAAKEGDKKKDPELSDKIRVSNLCDALLSAISTLVEDYCGERDDAMLPTSEFNAHILSRLGVSSVSLGEAVKNLLALGEYIQQERLKKGKLPRSYLHALAIFLSEWDLVDAEKYVHLAVSSPQSVEAYCLDPSDATSPLSNTFWSMHMSGTLRPLDEYRDSIGLEGAMLHIAPSPFPPKNRQVICALDVTTKWENWRRDEQNRDSMFEYLRILSRSSKSTMVFFPSFTLLDECFQLGAFDQASELFIEERGASQRDLMSCLGEFKERGGVFLSVMGGRISEGLDFPGNSLETVVIVGLPYPPPSARQQAMIRHYDRLFNKGWEYGVHTPMERKTLQAMGRLIRTEEDRGVVVFLDHRSKRLSDVFGVWDTVASAVDLQPALNVFFEEKD